MAEFDPIQPYLLPDLKSQYMTPMSPEQGAAILDNLSKVAKMKDGPKKKIIQQPDGSLGLAVQVPDELPVKQMPVKRSQDQDYEDLRSKLEAKLAESMNTQKSGISQMEQSLQGIKQSPRQLDFSALASYFDSIVPGSKLSSNYKAPETEPERQSRIMQLENAIQKAKEGVSDKEIDSMKALLNTHMYNKALSAQGRGDRQQRILEKDLGGDITKLSDTLGEEAQKFETLEENLSSGDYIRVMNSLSNFSRSVAGEKGVLTDADIARVLPKNFQGSMAKFEEYFRTTEPTQIPKEYTQSLVELTSLAKKKTADRLMQNLDQRELKYNNPNSAYYGVYSTVGKPQFESIRGRAKAISTPKVPSGGGKKDRSKMSVEELEAEAASRGL